MHVYVHNIYVATYIFWYMHYRKIHGSILFYKASVLLKILSLNRILINHIKTLVALLFKANLRKFPLYSLPEVLCVNLKY